MKETLLRQSVNLKGDSHLHQKLSVLFIVQGGHGRWQRCTNGFYPWLGTRDAGTGNNIEVCDGGVMWEQDRSGSQVTKLY